MDPAPDPAIWVIDLKDAKTKHFFPRFFCLLLLGGPFTSFFNNKKS